MSPARPPVPGESDQSGGAAVAGLAREVDGLRRRLDPLTGLPGRVDDLTGLVAELTTTVTALTARRGSTPCPSWLLHPHSPAGVGATLEGLCAWLAQVYLRYSDAVAGLPECWLWHPDVAEELLWLMHAWLGAYQGTGASVGLAADWHDRQRPGVVRRIKQTAASCSREAHMTREGWPRRPSAVPTVPGVEAVEVIARWWGSSREQPAPEPQPRDGTDFLPTTVSGDRPR